MSFGALLQGVIQQPAEGVHGYVSALRYLDRVVAKLPFDAHWTVAKIAHRGLTLPKANDCAVVGVLVT